MSIVGKTLNKRFYILKPLAQGGFGHTYLAEDLTFSARHHCVVKHLSPSKENLPHLARIKDLFEREADTLAKLSLYSNLIPKLIGSPAYMVISKPIASPSSDRNS